MTATNHSRLTAGTLILLALLALIACDSGGGQTTTPLPDAVRPSITRLEPNVANIGDQVQIHGINFGNSQASASARLNGLDFIINSWADTLVEVTVSGGMTSGIVVVTVGGLASQSGPEAQLWIGGAPTGLPIINAISPDFGVRGQDEILITGLNFGSTMADSAVFFTAEGAAVSQLGMVQAEVVTIDIGGTAVPQWTNASVRVIVPQTAATGPVYMVIGGVHSNSKNFEVLPPDEPLEGPVITDLVPGNGPVGTLVTLSGQNFGHQQGSSTLKIGGISLNVVSWSNSEIKANIPSGAETGSIRIVVGGRSTESGVFVVANAPKITGISPTKLKIGQPLTVYGHYFGFPQTPGTLQVGSTKVTPSEWLDNTVTVAALPSVTASDPDAVPIVVTSANGLSSDPFYGTLSSNLQVVVTVNPTAGAVNETEFLFNVSVAGGSGSYEYTLIPDADNPNATVVSSTTPIGHTYTGDATFLTRNFETQVRVRDKANSDTKIVAGPEVLVVATGAPVITDVELEAFNRVVDAPNDYCYQGDWADPEYYDFTFFGGQIYYGSPSGDVMDGGNPVPSITRNLRSFMSDSAAARPYGYRYTGGEGSQVRVNGLNFGTDIGGVWLKGDVDEFGNPVGGVVVPATNIVDWAEDHVSFLLPAGLTQHMSGPVVVQVAGGTAAKSQRPLVCSAYITSVVPGWGGTPVELDGTVLIQGFDLIPPVVSGLTGAQTYLIWIIQATYDDPFQGGLEVTRPALMVHPVPVTPVGNTITFNMVNLGAQAEVEVFNTDFTQSEIVTGDVVEGDGTYFFFLWTGALTEGSNLTIATSGIFSELYTIEVGGGGGPGGNRIYGTVTEDGTGTPIEGAQMDIIEQGGGGYTDTQLTNAAGQYSFEDVPDGEYLLMVELAGWGFNPGIVPGIIVPPDFQQNFTGMMGP